MSTAPKHAPGAPRMPFALLVLGLIVGSMCALLALNTASAANEVRRHKLAIADAAVSDSLVKLNNDVNESAAPQNLAAAAAALGMVPANNPAFLVIGPDGKVKVLGSPGAATVPPIRIAPTKTPSPTKTPTTSSTPTGKTSSTPGSKSSSSSSTPSNTPSPTPTPTPNTTLPGGPR